MNAEIMQRIQSFQFIKNIVNCLKAEKWNYRMELCKFLEENFLCIKTFYTVETLGVLKNFTFDVSLYVGLKRFFILTQTTFFIKRICRVEISELFNLKLTAKLWCSPTHNFRKTDFQ